MTIKHFLLIGFVVLGFSVQAQKKGLTDHRNIIKLNLNTDFDDEDGVPIMFSWEIKTNKNQSLNLGVAPRYFKGNGYKRSGIGLNGEYRFYISRNKTGITGVYVGPFASFNAYKVTNNYGNGQEYTYRSNDFRGGLIFGHQWVYLSGFSLDLNLGLGFVSSSNSNNNLNTPYYYNERGGLLGRFNVGIGYAF